MSQVCGADLVAKALKLQGVDTIFLVRGGPTNLVIEACVDLGMRLIATRHEQAAAMMAHAYSRVTGRPGVCLTGAGCDTLNTASGVATAFLDGTPLVAISGSVSQRAFAMGAFQQLDQLDVLKPIAKATWRCPTKEKIPYVMGMGFRRALSGAPGPVCLDFPADVLNNPVDESQVEPYEGPPAKHRPMGDSKLITETIEALERAERPVVLSGTGIFWSDASAELQEFINVTNLPFYTTPLSRGVIPEDHPLCFPGARTMALREADTILVLGTRASFIVAYLRPPEVSGKAKIIMVNIDADSIGHNRAVDIGIQGDAKAVLRQLIDEAKKKRFKSERFASWVDRLRRTDAERQAKMAPLLNSDQKPIHPLRLCKEVRDFLLRDAILAVDGHVILNYARQSIPTYYPGHRLNPGIAACMGTAIPFAVGAKVAKPEKFVMALTGDLSFGFNGMEVDTAVRHKLPIVVVVSNNGGAAEKRTDMRISVRDYGFTRYDKVAEALGAHGEFVEKPEDIRGALERAVAAGKPAVVNVITDQFIAPTTRMFGEDMMVRGKFMAT